MTTATMTPAAFARALADAHGLLAPLTAEEFADELYVAGLDCLVDIDGDVLGDTEALAAVNERLATMKERDDEHVWGVIPRGPWPGRDFGCIPVGRHADKEDK